MAKKFDKSTKGKAAAETKATVAAKKKADAESRKGISIGVEWGLGIVQTWNKLLGENHKRKLTDDQLLEAMKEEFPKRDRDPQPVARIRSWYNHGRYGLGKGEDVTLEGSDRSVAYDEDGNVLGRGGKPKAEKAPKAAKAEKAAAPKKKGLVAKKKAAA